MDLTGTTLAHYRITAVIGAGGMGKVYRATDSKLGRDVALKVLPAEMASNPDRLERFQREAKALATLDHPGVVSIYSIEKAEGVHFLTMQLIDGRPLDQLVPEGGLPGDQILAIGIRLAEALAAAHAKGIIHRDLKPANVMVTAEGRVKVLDFGLAKLTDTDQEVSDDLDLPTLVQTREGVVMGTVPYMSPEQVSGQRVDHRTDLFSLGILLYEMATGRRPFQGRSSAELASCILRDTPPAIDELRSDLPAELQKIIARCLAKNPEDRFPTAGEVVSTLRDLVSGPSMLATTVVQTEPIEKVDAPSSGSRRKEEGFWLAVLPFKYRGTDPAAEALADGMSEDIITGLSRFSYLRVISHSSTSRFAGEALDIRSVGQELGARYVMEGSVRQAGSMVRVAVQLVDTASGANLWADTYNRPFTPEEIFDLQDNLVPRIVSTVADMNGILPHTMSEALRSRDPKELSPNEAVLRALGFYERITVEEHTIVRDILERAVQEAPGQAEGWMLLSMIYANEYMHGFSPSPDSLDRALEAAQRAIAAAPSNNLALHMLAQARFFRREFQAFRNAADRAVALNPMDGCTLNFMGILMAYAGDWDYGLALAEKAITLNPHHPGWYRFGMFFNAYRQKDYQAALDIALKFNMPSYFYTHAATAAAYGQLGEAEAAQGALRELLALKPDFATIARRDYGKWFAEEELVEHVLDGLRKAGLAIPQAGGATATGDTGNGPLPVEGSAVTPAPDSATVAIAVFPFSDMSPGKDQDYLCEGMAEEIMNALVGVKGIRVASRTSAFRIAQEGHDLSEIARLLSVTQVLEGSVRIAGTRLRVTAQLTDTETGYQLWSHRFDREAADIFAIQDEIATGVVEAVKTQLAPGAHPVQARPKTNNLDAYRSYLNGLHLRGMEDHEGARHAFEEAVRLDPTHAPSWTGLAEVNVLAAHFSLIPADEGCAVAREAIANAKRLQGESADGLHAEAFVAFIERRWSDMETTWRRALELQPDHNLALGAFGLMLCMRQRLQEGLPFLERAIAADPLSSFPYVRTAVGYLNNRRPEEALHYVLDAFTYGKEDFTALLTSCMTKVALGNAEGGIADAERAVELSRRGPMFVGLLGWALGTVGRKKEAQALLEELRARPSDAPTVVFEASVLGVLGEIDEAFAVIDRAEEEYQAMLYYTGLPVFDSLRSDPRFTALLRRFELPSS